MNRHAEDALESITQDFERNTETYYSATKTKKRENTTRNFVPAPVIEGVPSVDLRNRNSVMNWKTYDD